MTQITARPAQVAPVRVGRGKEIHLGSLSGVKGSNGEPRYTSWCPAGRARLGKAATVGEAVAEQITCKSCKRQAPADALEQAAATAEAMTEAAAPVAECDHNGACIGCGAVRRAELAISGRRGGEPCTAGCGFATGEITAAIVLRATAGRLEQFTRGHGADLADAFAAATASLMEHARRVGKDHDIDDLIEAARHALGAYLDEVAGTDGDVPGVSLIEEYAVLVPRRQFAEALYLAAARHDGVPIEEVTRERWIGEGLRELEKCCPDAQTLLITITGPAEDAYEVEFLGTEDPGELYLEHGWVTTEDENAFNRAGELVVRAITLSLPPYLHPADDDAIQSFAIADTTYGKILHQH
ncbi:hypothetical protein ACQPZJ_44295 [Actinoplanes sp. CA-054009]